MKHVQFVPIPLIDVLNSSPQFVELKPVGREVESDSEVVDFGVPFFGVVILGSEDEALVAGEELGKPEAG